MLRLILWCLSTSTIHTVWLDRPSHGDGMVYLARLDVWWYMSTRHHTFLGHYSRSLCPAHGSTARLSPRGDNHRPGTDCAVTGTPPVAHGNTHTLFVTRQIPEPLDCDQTPSYTKVPHLLHMHALCKLPVKRTALGHTGQASVRGTASNSTSMENSPRDYPVSTG